ncbi:PorV/PorQ family protein [candidate division KSB1 bacterium]|nr:PorV/PorQ family protein [candidate division KSB1 bacterium]
MKKLIFLITYILIALIVTSIQAQTGDVIEKFPDAPKLKKVAQAGYTFLKIGVDARTTGFGEAGVTLEGDVSTVFFNPAGITSIKGYSVFTGYTTWFADIQKTAIAAGFELNKIGHFAISAAMMDYNSVEGTAIDITNPLGYRDTGNLGIQEYVVGLTYGRRFTDRFGVALTAKYCAQDLIAKKSNIFAIDVGTLYDIRWKGLKIGMSIQHFAPNMKYVEETFQLPLTFQIGAQANLLSFINIESNMYRLDFHLAACNPIDYSERFHFGLEYWFKDIISLRGGYKSNYDEEGISMGVGVRYTGIHFNYSFADFGPFLGSVNRFSANINF